MIPTYVLGFAIDKHDNMLLVRKSKPAWQSGLLNGVGGMIESFDETTVCAMCREFKEETSIETTADDWKYVTTMSGPEWIVYVYTMNDEHNLYSDFDGNLTDTDEVLSVCNVRDVIDNENCISNLGWLVGLCLDKQTPLEYDINFEEPI